MTCSVCELDPCLCERKSQPAAWIHQTCTTPGCSTVIRSRVGSQPDTPVCRRCSQPEEPILTGEIQKLVDKIGKRM